MKLWPSFKNEFPEPVLGNSKICFGFENLISLKNSLKSYVVTPEHNPQGDHMVSGSLFSDDFLTKLYIS
jgi:hypothetical protein